MTHNFSPAPSSTRLVLIVTSFPKLSETFIVSKFLGLLKKGWDIRVVCGESDPAQWKNFTDLENYPRAMERVSVNRPHRPRWLAAFLLPLVLLGCCWRNPAGTLRYLGRGTRKFGWDVIRRLYLDASVVALKPDVVHFEFGALAVHRMHLRDLLGCKVIVGFRGYDLNLSGLEQPDYFRDVWEHADALHLLSEGLWHRAQQRGCPSAKPHVLVSPAIDTTIFGPERAAGPKPAPGGSMRILSVGRLTWEKGYEYGIQAVGLLHRRGVSCELHIVGAGPALEGLAFARHQLGQTENVKFLGAMPTTSVREEMRRADVFLHAAVSEGFCNAVLEAQAMGLPVVSADAGGLPENVIDGETGFVVPRRDPQALAEKLHVLALSPSLRAQMGEAGRRRVRSRFRLEDQVTKFETLYRSVASGHWPTVSNR